MTYPYQDNSRPQEDRVEDLLLRLTREEKVSLMAGAQAFALEAIPRLGVPSLRMTDGPTGVRSNAGEKATVFPVAVALAATFNPDIVREVAGAIAREAKALGEQVILAPTINIVRTPLWGRNFETYSEDPHLTGLLGAAYVEGLQREGVGASLKHFAVNNQEHNRLSVSAEVDERTLREVYLAAFETIVKAANPWTVMASYNKVNGTYASENGTLLTDILKNQWHYDGVVVSDWGAVHSTSPAANAGLDLEMPGPPRHFGEKLLHAVRQGEVGEHQIDNAARRLIRLMLRTGLLDSQKAGGEVASARHRSIARRAAEESIVLLKNEGGLLPFDVQSIRSLAVIGPNAARTRLQGDGSSRVHTDSAANVLDGIRSLLGGQIEITYAAGVDNEPSPPAARPTMFSPDPQRRENGLTLEYFDDVTFRGEPRKSFVDRRLLKWVTARAPRREPLVALRWSGFFWPEKTGRHEFSVRGDGGCRVAVGDETLIDEKSPTTEDVIAPTGDPALRRTGVISLEAGRAVRVAVEYVWAKGRPGASFETVAIGVREPSSTVEDAVAAARKADAAVVVVGSASTTESEGYDRADIDLPGRQNELIEAILEANPRSAIIINSGAAMTLPWISRAMAVAVMWLPGEEGSGALADILFGKISPSGRLSVTFPARLEDNPAFGFYPGEDTVEYGEGLFVGYRHFDRRNIGPLFPFGHGLTYTKFEYADLRLPDRAGTNADVPISLALKNLGARSGMETVQIYVRPIGPPVKRPLKELKAFSKVTLEPGQTKSVAFLLPPRAFAYFDPAKQSWTVAPGRYEIIAAASATDVRLRQTITLA